MTSIQPEGDPTKTATEMKQGTTDNESSQNKMNMTCNEKPRVSTNEIKDSTNDKRTSPPPNNELDLLMVVTVETEENAGEETGGVIVESGGNGTVRDAGVGAAGSSDGTVDGFRSGGNDAKIVAGDRATDAPAAAPSSDGKTMGRGDDREAASTSMKDKNAASRLVPFIPRSEGVDDQRSETKASGGQKPLDGENGMTTERREQGAVNVKTKGTTENESKVDSARDSKSDVSKGDAIGGKVTDPVESRESTKSATDKLGTTLPPSESTKEGDDKKSNSVTATTTAAAAPASAAPAQYHPSYHYHHQSNGYPQYHHPGSQWNPQWNHRHPHQHPPQAQHPPPQGAYHPYYSRYPGYHPQYNHPAGGAPHNVQHNTNQQHPPPPPPPHQQQQQPQHPTVTTSKDEKDDKDSSANVPSGAASTASSWNSSQHQYPPHAYPPHWRGNYPQYNYGNYYHGWRNNNNNIHWSGSASVSTAEATKLIKNKKEKKRARDEGREGRDDSNERDIKRSYTDDTASTLSIGGLSMTSLEQSKPSSPKRRKGLMRNQKIHRDHPADLKQEFPRLDNTSTLSDGKMILQNLSINSLGSLRQSYSAEIAELCGPSPINVDRKKKGRRGFGEERPVDEGKTPKKRNTSSKKSRDPFVFRLDNAPHSSTPAAMRLASTSQDDDSPNVLDFINESDTPLTGVLLSSMENVMLDESLNKQLRGQAFTPLPHILGGDDVWSFNGSPLGSSFEKLTPRFTLDSTKSGKKNPLASPKSFWKDDFLEEHNQKKSKKEKGKVEGVQSILSMLSPAMREMEPADPALDGGPTSPIPILRKVKEEAPKASIDPCITTPLRRPPAQVTSASHLPPRPHPHSSPWRADQRGHPAIMHSPIPTHHSHHHPPHGMSPYDGRYGEHRRDAPPYCMYPPPHHGHYNPDDRIRNLRGRCPPVHHHMPPSHHLPPPSYHHFSPLTNVPRGRGWHENQHSQVDSTGMSASKRKCVPLRPPVPAKFQGDIEKYKDAQVPEFNNLVNFPGHMNQKQAPNVPEGMRCCVMCGQACPCSQGGKQKKGDKAGGSGSSLAPLGNNKNITNANTGNGFAIIPTQNKGLCTLCDVNVWIVTQTGLEIKWCKGCKNFRPWAAFGDKGLATKCVRCRDRQREKYALQKEEKERARNITKNPNHGPGSMHMAMGPR